MIMIELDTEELAEIYGTYMMEDFHSNEVKPLKMIMELMEKDRYKVYGMYEGNKLIAYGLMTYNDVSKYMLLDYYAVVKEYRGMGYGNEFLNNLKDLLKAGRFEGFIAEVENPEYATDEDDKKVREGRIIFYEKNDMRFSGVEACVFGSEYKAYYYSDKGILDSEYVYEQLDCIYKTMFTKEVYDNNVVIRK